MFCEVLLPLGSDCFTLFSLCLTMFYEGDLQSGIALAIQESKLVACFVRGEDSTSLRQY